MYDNEKNALLYRHLIADDGSGKIAELMKELHYKAQAEIALAEQRLKKQLAINEAAIARRNAARAVKASPSKQKLPP